MKKYYEKLIAYKWLFVMIVVSIGLFKLLEVILSATALSIVLGVLVIDLLMIMFFGISRENEELKNAQKIILETKAEARQKEETIRVQKVILSAYDKEGKELKNEIASLKSGKALLQHEAENRRNFIDFMLKDYEAKKRILARIQSEFPVFLEAINKDQEFTADGILNEIKEANKGKAVG